MTPQEPVATGTDLALRMQAAFPEKDWVAMLADRSGVDRDTVEWHLQEAMTPPEKILTAAAELLDDVRDEPHSAAARRP